MSENFSDPSNHNGQVAELIGLMHAMGDRLDRLERKVEARLPQTQPLRESVQSQFARLQDAADRTQIQIGDLQAQVGGLQSQVEGLQVQVNDLQAQVGGLRQEFGELRAGQERIEKEVRHMRKAFGKLYTDVQQELAEYDDRIESLETARQ